MKYFHSYLILFTISNVACISSSSIMNKCEIEGKILDEVS